MQHCTEVTTSRADNGTMYVDLSSTIRYKSYMRSSTTAGFLALRKLHEKLAWIRQLEDNNALAQRHSEQVALFVSPLPLRPPGSYLQPGSYLIAHPALSGYFRRAVICILDHRDMGGQIG